MTHLDDPPLDKETTTVVNVRYNPYDIYIGRGSAGRRSSVWGNPFHIGKDGSREEVIAKYRVYLLSRPDLLARLPELRGKRLGCFCKPLLCHGDVLLDLLKKEVSCLATRSGLT